MIHALRSLRPQQWTKNGFVLAAPFFAERLGELETLLVAAGAFGVFCAVSGAVYVFNDIFDLANDRAHPVKRDRPLAAGEMSPALILASKRWSCALLTRDLRSLASAEDGADCSALTWTTRLHSAKVCCA